MEDELYTDPSHLDPNGGPPSQQEIEQGRANNPQVRRTVSMAERSGDPQLDQLIEEFMSGHYDSDQYGWSANGDAQSNPETAIGEYYPVEDLRHPDVAYYQCDSLSKTFIQFLKERGIEASTSIMANDPHPDTSKYPSFEEHGYGDVSDTDVGEQSPGHCVVKIEMPSGAYSVDWTASQYGYQQFPMVQKLNVGGWQREWQSKTSGDWAQKMHPDIQDFQQGLCDTYAKAMIDMYPHLGLGVLNNGTHMFAHDDQYWYDSGGRKTQEEAMGGWDPGPGAIRLNQDPNDYFEYYPYGENGKKRDYERAKALIPQQHPWLQAPSEATQATL
jgi:hypothetical protein